MLVALNTLTNVSSMQETSRFSTELIAYSERNRLLIRFCHQADWELGKSREEESRIFALLACHAAAVSTRFSAGVY